MGKDLAMAIRCGSARSSSSGRRQRKAMASQDFHFRLPPFGAHLQEPGMVAAADELFYKGQLLPLQPGHRLQLLQALSSARGSRNWSLDDAVLPKHPPCSSFRSHAVHGCSSGSSGDSSRDSNGSSQDSSCLSLDDLTDEGSGPRMAHEAQNARSQSERRTSFSFKALFSGIVRASKEWLDEKERRNASSGGHVVEVPRESKDYGLKSLRRKLMAAERPSVVIAGTSYKEMWQKYVKKLRPLYAKMGLFGEFRMDKSCGRPSTAQTTITPIVKPSSAKRKTVSRVNSSSWRQPVGLVASCPASMRSSPNHSGLLAGEAGRGISNSSMRELESAIQGAIAHCKDSQAGKIGPKPHGRPVELVTKEQAVADVI